MLFTNPIWLWGLTGMAVPVAIHLLSRKEGKTIPLGSTRHLREAPTARFRHIRLNEIALLALRCLLILLFVALLAGFESGLVEKPRDRWLLIESGIEKDQRFSNLVDSLVRDGFEPRRLARGFPSIDEPSPSRGSYWALVEALSALPIDSAVVLSYNYLDRFHGKRIPLPGHVKWIPAAPDSLTAEAWRLGAPDGTTWSRRVSSSPEGTRFETVKNNTPAAVVADSVRVSIFSDREFAYDARVVRASVEALQSATPHPIDLKTQTTTEWSPESAGWVVWLSSEPAPPADSLVVYVPCPQASVLVHAAAAAPTCRKPPGALWLLTQRLNRDVALRSHLPVLLGRILLPEMEGFKDDKRVLHETSTWSPLPATVVVNEAGGGSDEPFLLALLLVILLTERWLAYKRNQ